LENHRQNALKQERRSVAPLFLLFGYARHEQFYPIRRHFEGGVKQKQDGIGLRGLPPPVVQRGIHVEGRFRQHPQTLKYVREARSELCRKARLFSLLNV
ncbi:MAG: hypothetical protein MR401_05790, partial [Bacteroidales bacterium]|nr:hypothetical protein [Bacteroidales bacterium]